MARMKREDPVVTEPVEKNVSTKQNKQKDWGGHVFYSVHSKSLGGFVTEHLDHEKACETVDAYWFEHRRNLATGKWSRRAFDMHIVKRDTRISMTHTEAYNYIPGSLSEQRREAKLRARYGDDYREEDDIENFDSSKYM